MAKKIQDIKLVSKNRKIDLRTKFSDTKLKSRAEKLVHEKNVIYKRKTEISEMKDLVGKKPEHFMYIRGKQMVPPRFLGNLLRVFVAGLIIILLINVVNVYFKGKTLERDISTSATEGYSFLVDAGKSATKIEFDNATQAFSKALQNFSEAESSLWFINTDKSFYAKNTNLVKSIDSLLKSGKYFAMAGESFTDALEEFNKLPLYFVSKNTGNNGAKPSITATLKLGLAKTDAAIEKVNLAADEIGNVDTANLPSEIKAKVEYLKTNIESFSETLKATSNHFPAILKLLGDGVHHRYLILLQNNDEIRPSGGFIGSYIILDMKDGYIANMQTQDVYDLDGAYGGVIEPPAIMKDFTQNIRFRDANYSSDFPTSAAEISWMLEKEKGPSVDSVITLNQSLLKDFLEITGPIQVGSFGKLSSENYSLLLSYVIEGKIWGAEDPKHILKIFIPAFKDAIFKEENIGKITSKIYRAIQQKDIMMWSKDKEVEAFFDATGVSGKVAAPQPDEDYLSVVNFSIGGTKSDKFIEEKITHDTNIGEDGIVTDLVTIKRTHTFTNAVYMQWKRVLAQYGFREMPDWLIDILGRGVNIVTTRIYVPEGSRLVDANTAMETKYDNDLKRTYFYTKTGLNAGESKEITVQYKLPFKLDFGPAATYKLVVDKQPGSRGDVFTKTISAAKEVLNLGTYPEDARLDENGSIIYATNLMYDRYFSSVWSK